MLQSTATPISGTSADRSLSPEPEYSEPVSLARTSSLRSFRASHSVTVRKDCEGNKFINNYQVLDDLGSGAYSKVKLVQNVDDGTLYALKILHKAELRKMGLGESNGLLKVQREIAILRKLDHPNIIRLFEVIDDVRCHKIYLVLEYAEFGSLMSLDRFGKVCADEHGCRTISEENARKFMRSLTSALRYAHENGVIHRDIKPENILLTESGDVKLTDFGVSMFLRTPNFFYCQSQSTTQPTTPLDPAIIEPALYEKPSDLVFCDETLSGTSCKGRTNSHHSNISLCSLEHNSGRENITLSEDFLSNSCDAVNLDEMYSECLEIQGTPAFLAPELLGEPRYIDLRLVDAWALSVTLFTLLFGQLPFLANTASEMAMSIINDVVVIPPAEYEEAAEKPVSEELRAFLVQVLQKDPAQRLSITEMMDHPWLTEDSLVPPSPRGTRPRIQVNDAFIASAIRQGWDIDLRTLQNNHPHARRRSSSVASSNVHPRFTSTDDMNSLDTCSDASEAAVITSDFRKTDGVLHHLYPSKHASHRTVLSEDASEPIQGPLDRQKINSWHPHLLARRANKKGRSRAVTFGCAS